MNDNLWIIAELWVNLTCHWQAVNEYNCIYRSFGYQPEWLMGMNTYVSYKYCFFQTWASLSVEIEQTTQMRIKVFLLSLFFDGIMSHDTWEGHGHKASNVLRYVAKGTVLD